VIERNFWIFESRVAVLVEQAALIPDSMCCAERDKAAAEYLSHLCTFSYPIELFVIWFEPVLEDAKRVNPKISYIELSSDSNGILEDRR
jgi:hypothetical protein